MDVWTIYVLRESYTIFFSSHSLCFGLLVHKAEHIVRNLIYYYYYL